ERKMRITFFSVRYFWTATRMGWLVPSSALYAEYRGGSISFTLFFDVVRQFLDVLGFLHHVHRQKVLAGFVDVVLQFSTELQQFVRVPFQRCMALLIEFLGLLAL